LIEHQAYNLTSSWLLYLIEITLHKFCPILQQIDQFQCDRLTNITMEVNPAKNVNTKAKSIYESFLPNAKAQFKGKRKFPEVKPSELNTKQRVVYDELLKYLEGQDETPFRMVVAGKLYIYV